MSQTTIPANRFISKGTCKKTMVICFRAANACPKVYVSALVSANFGLRLVETAVTHSSKPTIFSLALPDSTLKHLIDDRPLYVDIECVHLTTDNIVCRHHRPMSRFVSAEDTAFTFLSHYVPVTAVPHFRSRSSTCNRPHRKQVLVLCMRTFCLELDRDAQLESVTQVRDVINSYIDYLDGQKAHQNFVESWRDVTEIWEDLVGVT
ncbi:hypothetical protein B0H10DRAFT_1964624 [Mycena sp. CBHHK59/15]|nr:hypothetical protein B0H10DRAFT_1964624 [Mycena sp. CBHHK59/15]